MYEKVLDHGFVRLVSYMQPARPVDQFGNTFYDTNHAEVRKLDSWSGDLEVVRNARVSFDADWRTGDDEGKDAKLITRMMRDWHSSPFEAMVFTFEIKAPIFVVRQWHRHRTWSYNEVSARYAELPEEFYIPHADAVGVQSTSNKQVRDILEDSGISNESLKFIQDLQEQSEQGFKRYKEHLAAGIPRELARLFLGLNTYTRMFATVDLHNLLHFVRLRTHSHAQMEIQVYAHALLRLVKPVVTECVKAYKEHR